MEKLFEDILTMDGVHGVVLLSDEGKVLFESLDRNHFLPEKSTLGWKAIIDSFDTFKEMDLIFERGRFYMVKTANGFLIISMSLEVPIAMLKLNCDIVVPQLKKLQNNKGLKRFFRF